MKGTPKIIMGAFLVFVFAGVAPGASVTGVVYHDGNLSSQSLYKQSVDAHDALLPDVEADLLSAGEPLASWTGEDGRYLFADLAAGTYFLDPRMDAYECTSSNRGKRTAQALREGLLTITSIGDSIGAMMYPPQVPYPERLGALFEPLADVTVNNLHAAGSTSWQWLPGAEERYFEDRLLPVLPDSDVVTITLGGNDLAPYIEGMSPPYDIMQILQNFFAHPEYLLDVTPRIEELIIAIQEARPDCDVVLILYPNFINSTTWQSYTGALQPLAAAGYEIIVSIQRSMFAGMDGVIIADTDLALEGVWLDDYLADEVHPSEAGSQAYAETAFEALGGVVLTDEAAEAEIMHGFDAPDLVPPADDETADDDTTTDDDTADDDTAIDIDDDADDDVADDDETDDDADDDSIVDDDSATAIADSGDDDDDDGGCGC